MSTEVIVGVGVTLAAVLVPVVVSRIATRRARRRGLDTFPGASGKHRPWRRIDPGGQAPHDEPDEAA